MSKESEVNIIFTILTMRFSNSLKICLLILCLSWYIPTTGTPQFQGATVFMKEIKITSPKYGEHVVLVDDQDFEYLSKFTWSVSKARHTFYARTMIRIMKNKQRTVRMHRMLLNTMLFVDHKDGNGLNNQRNNLRVCTHAQNVHNSRKRSDSTLNYKGVAKANDGRGHFTWVAWITINRTRTYLGSFRNDRDAALAYNKAAQKHFGEFAKLNEILS